MLIYKITNLINNKQYVGQTTLSLQDRIYNYKKEVKWKPDSRPIIKAINKYGFDNFKFEIIKDNIKTKAELDYWEKFYISKYKTLCSYNGYNIELGGNGPGKHSEETKRKIAEAQKGKKNHQFGKVGKLNVTSKPIIELTTGKRYESANLAAKELNLNFSHVCAVARGTRGSTGGYVFRYLGEHNTIIQPSKMVKIRSKDTKDKVLEQYKYLI